MKDAELTENEKRLQFEQIFQDPLADAEFFKGVSDDCNEPNAHRERSVSGSLILS